MDFTYGLKLCKELVELDIKALAIACVEKLGKYSADFEARGIAYAQKQLTATDRLILGLGWSEFFAKDTTDFEYVLAEEKRKLYLKRLGIDSFELYKAIELLYGRKVS